MEKARRHPHGGRCAEYDWLCLQAHASPIARFICLLAAVDQRCDIDGVLISMGSLRCQRALDSQAVARRVVTMLFLLLKGRHLGPHDAAYWGVVRP